MHDSWILPKHEAIQYSDLDWKPTSPQSSKRYCVTGRDQAASCLLHGPCLSGRHVLFECPLTEMKGSRGKNTGGKMPKVVAYSRDKYSASGVEVRLIPVPTLPVSNNTLPSDVIQSQDTVYVMLEPFYLGEIKMTLTHYYPSYPIIECNCC